jgi:hypothetical protein
MRNPEGIASLSPGLRAARYPGCVRPNIPPTLKGLYPRRARSILAAMTQSFARTLIESRQLLKRYEVVYDERYVWDCLP